MAHYRQHVHGYILEICNCQKSAWQAIQGDDTPADTTFPCVNLEGNPFHDTTWPAFEEAACTHASASECPNSNAPKFKHFPNLHGALRTHMQAKHRHTWKF
eukprot:1151572-Pelagomonas_calceolata.AAC.11